MCIRGLFMVNIILIIMNSLLLTKLEWNLLPVYVQNLLLICHVLSTGIKLPGAVAYFNMKIVEVITLDIK